MIDHIVIADSNTLLNKQLKSQSKRLQSGKHANKIQNPPQKIEFLNIFQSALKPNLQDWISPH